MRRNNYHVMAHCVHSAGIYGGWEGDYSLSKVALRRGERVVGANINEPFWPDVRAREMRAMTVNPPCVLAGRILAMRGIAPKCGGRPCGSCPHGKDTRGELISLVAFRAWKKRGAAAKEAIYALVKGFDDPFYASRAWGLGVE